MRLLIDYGASCNLGDLSMLEGAVGRLRDLHPRAELAVIDRGYQNTDVWDLGVSRQPERLANEDEDARRIAAEMCAPFDALHICGGGNLTDTFPWELRQKSIRMSAFIERGKPVVLTGQQLGPFQSLALQEALSQTLRRVRFVGVREPGSEDFCERAGLDRACFELMGDDSFGLAPADEAFILNLLSRMGLRPGRFLAFNLRLGFYSGGLDRHLDLIAAILKRVAGRLSLPILIVPISLNRSDDDIRAGQAVAARLSSSSAHVLQEALTPAVVKGVLGKAFGAVGVSYHFCTFALSQGVPAVCIFNGEYYARKARGLAAFWEDRRLALALDGNSPATPVDQIAHALADGKLRERLLHRAGKAVEKWRSAFDRESRAALAKPAEASR